MGGHRGALPIDCRGVHEGRSIVRFEKARRIGVHRDTLQGWARTARTIGAVNH
jgi:hypothetical protein